MTANHCHYEQVLEGLELYGWNPKSSLSADENLMDLTMLVTRSSKLRQGSMACILVRSGYDCVNVNDVRQYLISVATNQALFEPNDSDIHAEVAALGMAARLGRGPTDRATAFITMPPCKRCFGALVAAGICKIVSRKALSSSPSSKFVAAYQRRGVEYTNVGETKSQESRARIQALIDNVRGAAMVDGEVSAANNDDGMGRSNDTNNERETKSGENAIQLISGNTDPNVQDCCCQELTGNETGESGKRKRGPTVNDTRAACNGNRC